MISGIHGTGLAVISGAAGGVGMACARLLGRSRRLLLNDFDQAALDRTVATLTDEGYQVDALGGDLARPDLARNLAERADNAPLDCLVNCAGLSPVQGGWQQIVRANWSVPVNLLDAFERRIRQGTTCAMIASVAGHLGPREHEASRLPMTMEGGNPPEALQSLLDRLVGDFGGSAEGHAYSVSKREVIAMCERRAQSWAERGGRIVSISPGMIATPMGRREVASGKRARDLLDATPCGRWGRAMDVATLVEFVVSDQAGFITGCDIKVDGGVSARLRETAFW